MHLIVTPMRFRDNGAFVGAGRRSRFDNGTAVTGTNENLFGTEQRWNIIGAKADGEIRFNGRPRDCRDTSLTQT